MEGVLLEGGWGLGGFHAGEMTLPEMTEVEVAYRNHRETREKVELCITVHHVPEINAHRHRILIRPYTI